VSETDLSDEAGFGAGMPSITKPEDTGLFKYPDGLAENFSMQRAQQK
jgi:hypothetical protein